MPAGAGLARGFGQALCNTALASGLSFSGKCADLTSSPGDVGFTELGKDVQAQTLRIEAAQTGQSAPSRRHGPPHRPREAAWTWP